MTYGKLPYAIPCEQMLKRSVNRKATYTVSIDGFYVFGRSVILIRHLGD